MGFAICSRTQVILINGKNIVNLAIAASITLITMMVRNQSDQTVYTTSHESHLKSASWPPHTPLGMEAGKAFGDMGSSNPGICHWEQMSQKPTFWKTATVSPTA